MFPYLSTSSLMTGPHVLPDYIIVTKAAIILVQRPGVQKYFGGGFLNYPGAAYVRTVRRAREVMLSTVSKASK